MALLGPSYTMRIFRHALIVFLGLYAFSTAKAGPVDQELFSFATDLKQNRQYLLSSIYYGWVANQSDDSDLRWRSLIQYCVLMDRLDQKDESHRILMKGLSTPNGPQHENFQLLAATRGLFSKASFSQGQTNRFALWEGRYAVDSTPLSPDLQNLQKALRREEKRNAPLGMALSAMVPGAGQAYLGDFQAAGLSFLVNALFGLATYQLFHEDLLYVGSASALIFSVTYTGNIFNVLKITQRRKANLKRRIDARMLDDVLFPVRTDTP